MANKKKAVEPEREIFASSFLLAFSKTRLAAFSMHRFIDVSPVLLGFFARTI